MSRIFRTKLGDTNPRKVVMRSVVFPIVVWFWIALLVPSLVGQTVEQVVEKPSAKCTLEGQVVKAGTGEPLKKARIVLRKAEGRGEPHLALTDASGRFLLKDIEPARYRLFVARNGYVRQEYGQPKPRHPGTILALAPGQQVRDILFQLIPAAVIAGRVSDEDSEPVARVMVMALQYRYLEGRRELFPSGQGVTNDRGEYRIYGLAPGRYSVSATYSAGLDWAVAGEGFVSMAHGRDSVPDEGYAPTYYPGTNDASRAGLLELGPGDEVTAIDLTLLPTRTVRLRGRVFNAITGKPGREVMLWLHEREGGGRRILFRPSTHVEDPEGKFEIRGVVPGSYLLLAGWHDGDKEYSARLPLEVGNSHLEGIELVIERGVELPGRVQVESVGQTRLSPGIQREAEVSAEKEKEKLELAELHVYLQSREELPFWGGGSGRVNEDGSFTLRNASASDYWVGIGRLPEDYYLKSARLGGDDVLEEGLTVSGPPKGSLDLVLSAAGGTIAGAVLDEERKAFSGATVALVPEVRHRERRELFKTTTTDQYGRFTLRGIPPGEYKLFAWQEIEPGAYQDPDFLRLYEDKGDTVRVKEGDRLAAELGLIRSGETQ
jgi:hypothetical protein